MENKNEELYETIPHLLYIYVRTLFCVNKYIVPFKNGHASVFGINNKWISIDKSGNVISTDDSDEDSE